jgi:spore maturation protein CgeB
MRLLKLTSLYQQYIAAFYDNRPKLVSQSYAAQKEALDYDAFGWGDFWSHALQPLGYEVMEVSANVESLQKAWALENGVKFHPDTWLWDIPWAQVLAFQPDILFMDDYSTYPYEWLMELREACPTISLILGWCGAPYQGAAVFKAYDLVLSCVPELVDHFRSQGHQSVHLNHAFEPRVLTRLKAPATPDIDFSFIGSLNRGRGGHSKREQLLLEMARQVDVQIFTPNLELGLKQNIKTLAKGVIYQVIQGLRQAGVSSHLWARIPKLERAARWTYRPMFSVHPRLRGRGRPGVFGLEMYRTLQRSKLTFNSHIDISLNSASNVRLFEATGVGTCLITDMKANLGELFEPDREVMTYRSAEECVEKVRWLLDHPEERHAIAQAGQHRTLRDHTFVQRAAQLDEIIQKALVGPK